jgi:hypothetical protein
MSRSGGTTVNSLKKTSENSLTTDTLGPWLASYWLSFTWLTTPLAMTTDLAIYSSSFLSKVVSLKDILAKFMCIMCFLNQSLFQKWHQCLWIQNNKAGDKVYPPLILRFNLWHIVLRMCLLLWPLTSVQRQHRLSEYLRGYMVDSSSNVVLLISARVGFLRQFNANGHWQVRWHFCTQS